MSASEEIRETVRRRYAAAATSSAAGDHEGALEVEASCCGPSPVATTDRPAPVAATSCCGPAPVAKTDERGRVGFGAELYGPEAEGASENAVAATDIEIRPTHRVHTHAQAAIIRASSGPLAAKGTAMTVIEVFEPALCCATRVCGEDVDQRLVTFSADMDFVASRGGNVRRYNLASEPLVFAESQAVRGFLQVVGSKGLPLVLVDGVTAMTGGYPDRAQLAEWAGVAAHAETGSAPAPAGATMLDLTAAPTSGICCSSPSAETSDGCCSSETADTSSGCCSSSTGGTPGCS